MGRDNIILDAKKLSWNIDWLCIGLTIVLLYVQTLTTYVK